MDFYHPCAEVKKAMMQAWIVLLAFIYFDCMQAVTNSNIQGLQLVSKVTWVTLFDYWVIGIPISIYTMFYLKWGLGGLWMGPTVACAMNYIIYNHYISRADWVQISKDTVAKLEEESNKLENEKKE